MKSALLFFVLFSVLGFARPLSKAINSASYPLFLIDGIIANEKKVKTLSQNEIQTMSIYKSEDLPENLENFSNFSLTGIIEITLKKKKQKQGATIPLTEINILKKVDELNPVYIDGVRLQNPRLKIFEDVIEDIEIIRVDEREFVNVWTLSSTERAVSAAQSDTSEKAAR